MTFRAIISGKNVQKRRSTQAFLVDLIICSQMNVIQERAEVYNIFDYM